MDLGRIHCFVVATKGGDVVYERYFERLSELEKAEIRAALSIATGNVRFSMEEQDFVASYRWAGLAGGSACAVRAVPTAVWSCFHTP